MRKEEYTKDKLEEIIASGDKEEIINVITSSALYGENYNYALELCDMFYSDPDADIRSCTLYALKLILINFKEIDLDVAFKIIKYALKRNDRDAEQAFSDVCHRIPLKQRCILREKLKKFYKLYNLYKYDYLFATRKEIKESLAKRKKRERELEFCCEDMNSAVKDKFIEYEMTTREYYIVSAKCAKDIKFCPWCKAAIKQNLVNEYFDLLDTECNIAIPDLKNYINIPDEFKTDEWWRKRGL